MTSTTIRGYITSEKDNPAPWSVSPLEILVDDCDDVECRKSMAVALPLEPPLWPLIIMVVYNTSE